MALAGLPQPPAREGGIVTVEMMATAFRLGENVGLAFVAGTITPMLSVEDAASDLKVTSSWIRRLIREGRLPATKIAAVWLVKPGDLAKFKKTDHHKAGRPTNARHRKYQRLKAARKS
jgi:excisionase family DNA binding protein